MKIKTVVHNYPNRFDDFVNQYLEKGYLLEERGVMPVGGDGEVYHYARLVLLDPPAETEPEEFDPIQALYAIRRFCDAQEKCGVCPIYSWCCQLSKGGDPTDWELPEEVPF